jgi:chorismate--pyruvate lyase
MRRRSGIPEGVLGWIRDEGSLTRSVMQRCAERFRVRVLLQGWMRPLAGEGRVLGRRLGASVLVREVELLCGERPWVFARTLIPASTLQGGARRLARLRDKPLGAVLFADPQAQRGPVEVARLVPHHLLYQSASRHLGCSPHVLWARRTLFFMAGRPLMVTEVFLPDLLEGP